MSGVTDLSEKEDDFTRAQEKLLKKMESTEELIMSCRKTCSVASLSHYKEGGHEEDKTVVGGWSSLQSLMRTDKGYYAAESADILTLFHSVVGEEVLRVFLRYVSGSESNGFS